MILRQQSVDSRRAGSFFPFRATTRAGLRTRAERMLSCGPIQRAYVWIGSGLRGIQPVGISVW